ncbi:transcriptional repressor [Radiobacillus kanasensis]|uniref:Fur family transcriptional regulator n=1 Tax=Radiobacillus kanasensis TaxID=2844358 RepID=UPI001E4A3435|nr:Fur family transcriptional regulator [Radiobacillus kanasensis]UFT98265.1 transcriptional repressor [Radiobacillus kanasensis]
MDVKDALDILKENGYKYTGKREDMIGFFAGENRYRSAKDLLGFMEPTYNGISYDTIYRNLHLFSELGILESTELNGEKQFRIKCDTHHHHHFICKDCGFTKEVLTCPMDDIRSELDRFIVQDHKFEIYGLCPACQ